MWRTYAGRSPEAVYVNPVTGKKERVEVVDGKCTLDDIALFAPLFNNGETPSHKRVGIPGTLHRLSLITHPAKRDAVIAVTARVGRAMEGVVARMVPFLLPSPPAAAAAAPLTRASTLPYNPFTFTSGTPSSSPGGPSLGGGAFASPSPREGPSPGGAFASWTSSSSAASSALAKAVADASKKGGDVPPSHRETRRREDDPVEGARLCPQLESQPYRCRGRQGQSRLF